MEPIAPFPIDRFRAERATVPPNICKNREGLLGFRGFLAGEHCFLSGKASSAAGGVHRALCSKGCSASRNAARTLR